MQTKRLWLLILAVVVMGTLFVISPSAQEDTDKTENPDVAFVLEYMDAWVTGNADTSDYVAEDAIRYVLFGPDAENGTVFVENGREEIGMGAASYHENFPNAEWSVEQSYGRNGYVWTEYILYGDPDTETPFIGLLMAHVQDGVIDRMWVAMDELALLSLLDAIDAIDVMNEMNE